MSDLLRTVLADLADEMHAVDRSGSAARAWTEARRQRRRRKVLMGIGAVALAVAVPIGLAQAPTPRGALPATRVTVTPDDGMPTQKVPVVVQGVIVDQLAAAQVGSIPQLAIQADGASLPLTLSVQRQDVLPALGTGVGTAGRIGAVVLRDLGAGRARPVLFVGGSVGGFVEVTGVTLTPSGSLVNGKRMVLGAHIVNRDGYRVGFIQDRSVVFVDIRDGSVRQIPVPTDHLERGGWSAGGTWFIAHSETAHWRIDPSGPTVQSAEDSVHEGSTAITSDGEVVQLLSYDDSGALVSRHLLSPQMGTAWSDTVTSPGGLVATGSFTSAQVSSTVDGYQGMSFAGFDEGGSFGRPRVLVLTGMMDAPKGAFTALGWVSENVVLYRLVTHDAARLMAWDISRGRSWFVADLAGADLGVGVALGVGLQATSERPR
ncbi:MAG: hypothetical protein KBF43_00805 [Dermatophilaceae bacterium]|nr:hypothetical protein [Dermatophilaceae bacterium]MBP9917112.1 hypothetical protein [Dermatophilaceae bacterium]